MKDLSRQELLNILIPYSSIDSADIAQIGEMRFVNCAKKKLNSVCIEMNRYLQDDAFFQNVSIATKLTTSQWKILLPDTDLKYGISTLLNIQG